MADQTTDIRKDVEELDSLNVSLSSDEKQIAETVHDISLDTISQLPASKENKPRSEDVSKSTPRPPIPQDTELRTTDTDTFEHHEQATERGDSIRPQKFFLRQAGYVETILDKLITAIANLLARLDFFIGRSMRKSKNNSERTRAEREMELEEFMNERAKDAIGKKMSWERRKEEEEKARGDAEEAPTTKA